MARPTNQIASRLRSCHGNGGDRGVEIGLKRCADRRLRLRQAAARQRPIAAVTNGTVDAAVRGLSLPSGDVALHMEDGGGRTKRGRFVAAI